MSLAAVQGASMAAQVAAPIKQGQAMQGAANYNASIMDQNASISETEGAFQAKRQGRMAAQSLGAIRAQYSASGIDSGQGSALDVIKSSAEQAAMDSALIKYSASSKAYGYRQSASLSRFEGDQAMQNGYLSAAGSLLSEGSKMATMAAGAG